MQLGCVLDGDEAFLVGNMRRKRIQHGCLTGTGTAGHDQRHPRGYGGSQHLADLGLHGADLNELVQVERLLGKLTDRNERSIDGEWRDDGVDAAAVCETGVDHGLGFVDAAADVGDNLVQNAQQVRFVLETDGRQFKLAETFHINLLVRIDEDVRDGRVLQQGFEGPQTGHFVVKLSGELIQFLGVERQSLGQNIFAGDLLHLFAQLLLWHLVECGEVDLLDHLAVQAHLGVQKLWVAQFGFAMTSRFLRLI